MYLRQQQVNFSNIITSVPQNVCLQAISFLYSIFIALAGAVLWVVYDRGCFLETRLEKKLTPQEAELYSVLKDHIAVDKFHSDPGHTKHETCRPPTVVDGKKVDPPRCNHIDGEKFAAIRGCNTEGQELASKFLNRFRAMTRPMAPRRASFLLYEIATTYNDQTIAELEKKMKNKAQTKKRPAPIASPADDLPLVRSRSAAHGMDIDNEDSGTLE